MRCGILTLSDKGAKREREDLSGEYLKKFLEERGWEVCFYQILPDEKDKIIALLKSWCDDFELDLILTTGGTGVHPRDVTPEATKDILDKEIPGIAEYIRYISFSKTPRAALSRGLSGLRKKTLIINLPGSPRALKEIMPSLIGIIEHGVSKIKGDPSECARD
ncbi:cytoplasmic protein [Caldimicrobium thiodismutans]|jgi:molybdenum cofactor synthesis domain-containing protein|uniref:Molybdopterin adenylyltransferase n=1 Tax=Caldimicrobium thiodismutans TaxID=1653476 RepID=A0A0U4W436_9BACT|nr:MogA/MoaB family molybdenum cofactor biosynthesis protein [Caldimicrobium thiodismutans]BAU23866.1 cytoplasmic protein [Caldimicrobium thiodismutans]